MRRVEETYSEKLGQEFRMTGPKGSPPVAKLIGIPETLLDLFPFPMSDRLCVEREPARILE